MRKKMGMWIRMRISMRMMMRTRMNEYQDGDGNMVFMM